MSTSAIWKLKVAIFNQNYGRVCVSCCTSIKGRIIEVQLSKANVIYSPFSILLLFQLGQFNFSSLPTYNLRKWWWTSIALIRQSSPQVSPKPDHMHLAPDTSEVVVHLFQPA